MVGFRRARAWIGVGAAVGVAALMLPVASCSTGTPLATDTGIEASVVRGPLYPVSLPDRPDEAPVAGARVRAEPTDGGRTGLALSDAAGIAEVGVPAGTYRVTVESCPGALTLPAAQDSVVVVEGAFTVVSFSCDTGIR